MRLIALAIFLVSYCRECYSSNLIEDQCYFAGFQSRLKNTFSNWWWDDPSTETYYRFLPSQHSKPNETPVAGFIEAKIKINNEQTDVIATYARTAHMYTIVGCPLKIDLSRLSMWEHNRRVFPIVVTYKDAPLDVDWVYGEEKKRFIDYSSNVQEFLKNIQGSYWHRKIIATAHIPPTIELRQELVLEISIEYEQKHLLDCKGMAISYNKAKHKTAIFFDLLHPLGQGDDKYLLPQTPDPGKLQLIDHNIVQTRNKNCFWAEVPDGNIWEHQAQEVTYNIFGNVSEGSKWVLPGEYFMKYPGTAAYAPLPALYTTDDSQAKLSKLMPVKILSRIDPEKRYTRLPEKQQVNSDHLYTNGHGKFFPTHCFEEKWQERSVRSQNNVAPLTVIYLLQAEPEIVKANVKCSPDDIWQQGVYKRIGKNVSRNITRETWRHEGSDIEKIIEFETNKIEQSFYFPPEGLMNQLNQQTIQTIQMFNLVPHIRFPQRINRLNESLCTSLSEFHKITELNLSKTKFGKSNVFCIQHVPWSKVFECIGNLTQLTNLNLCMNTHTPSFLSSLEGCLGKLTALTVLKVQGHRDYLRPSHFNSLCAIFPKVSPQLRSLHLDNLPGATSYRTYNYIVSLNEVAMDLMMNWGPEHFIETAANNLASLPQLVSLTLYQRNSDSFYNYAKQDDFKNKIKEIALRKGKNNLNIESKPLQS